MAPHRLRALVTFYIISQVLIFNFHQILLRSISWRYMFNVTQTPVNKQRYWMDLMLSSSYGGYVRVA